MTIRRVCQLRLAGPWLWAGLVVLIAPAALCAQVVPGTGTPVEGAGDDFEDADWQFYHNLPKGSFDIDNDRRYPLGYSHNERWHESPKRGQPDVLKRIETPAGGLEGSTGALLLRSFYTGVPGYRTGQQGQDDLIFDCDTPTGGGIPVSASPSVVVRVYMPPFEQWENRTATSFGFRCAVDASAWKEKRRLFFKSKARTQDTWFPGIFIQFNSAGDKHVRDSAAFVIRGGDDGEDYVGPIITQTGWWTLGMSFTPDGRCHYYASPGVDALTAEDRIGSNYPQGITCQKVRTYFFNVCNGNSGGGWSTDWTIDDPQLYSLYGYGYGYSQSGYKSIQKVFTKDDDKKGGLKRIARLLPLID
ncbi:MAG: hypothetical protein KY476_18535 [Planctomycetes bacterium]|nr:hypothetical protein [Planctomycetota bacterium]